MIVRHHRNMAGGDDIEGERLVVWVDGWQQECCGDPWSIGSTVSWTLGDADDDYLAPLFPPESGVTVDRAEEHHGGLAEDAPSTSGIVVAIHGVQLRYEPMRGDPRMLYPVPGSAHLTPLTQSDGDERRSEGFAGYLVEIET